MDAKLAFVRREMAAALEPPRSVAGVPGWLRQRLFGSVSNCIFTVLAIVLVVALVWPTLRFLLLDAVFAGSRREDCLPETAGRSVGACWPFVVAKFRQFMYGFYPESEQWRVNLSYALGALLLVPLLVPRVPHKAL